MEIKNIIFVIIAILVLVAGSIGGYIHSQSEPWQALVDDQLEGNPAAEEIATIYKIPVTYEELGQDGNGYTVCGQTQWQVYSDGSQQLYKVILDDDIDPNSYQAKAILYHELGHIVLNGGTEEQADQYAASRGYDITDAYHGIH